MSGTTPGTTEHAARRGLTVLVLVLRMLTLLLGLATVAAVVLSPFMILGANRSFGISAEVEPPYSVRLPGESIDVRSDGDEYHERTDAGGSSRLASTRVRTRTYIGDGDTGTRLVVVVTVLMCLALMWVGLVNLRRVVWSARAGDPFDVRNVSRLRWLAGAVLVFPGVATLAAAVVEQTLDVAPDVSVPPWGPSWWASLLVALGFLALAEVFREGSALRALERETI